MSMAFSLAVRLAFQKKKNQQIHLKDALKLFIFFNLRGFYGAGVV